MTRSRIALPAALLMLAFLTGNAPAQGTLSLESIKGIYEKTLQKIEQDSGDTLKGLPHPLYVGLGGLFVGVQ